MTRAVMLVAAIVYGYLAGYRRARDETLRELGRALLEARQGEVVAAPETLFEGR
ncbi:MAG: hypothetical protein QM714_00105 [Nocardioides sp.]|uniref:hypothetical protein n=1 Tax=Nocardioides sp. TaxID=35761 RepID=UPI0039E3F4FC